MKLYEKFSNLSYWFRYKATYLEMKYHLKQVLKSKEEYYIKTVRHYDRNIGKSTALARLSAKYNIPIVVPTFQYKVLIECEIPNKLPKYFRRNKPKTIPPNESNGIKYTNILFEEGLTDAEIKKVKNMTLKGVVGYRYSHN